MPKLVAVAVAGLLTAAFLAACGGSGSGSSTAASSEAGATSTSAAGGKQDGSRAGGQSKQASETGSAKRSEGSKNVATPLRVSGGGSAQFRSKGGDNSIQEFGEESAESELQEAAEALHGFYVARATEDWSAACGHLEKSMAAQLEQLAAQSQQLKGKGCAAALQAFTRPLPASVRRETTLVDAASLRRDGERAFLIYRGAERTVYAMPMQEEGGSWKVGLLSASPLG